MGNSIPTVIDDEKASKEDKLMPPDSTKTGDYCSGCGNEIVIYATGICNHQICHLCALRSRVIFLNDKCCVCKENMPLLILTKTSRDFGEIIGEKLFMERSSNWSNSEFWSSNLPKVVCESCDSCTCHHIYMSGTTYNMMIHFDSNNNSKIKSKRFGFRNNNGLWRIKTRRFTLDFEDIYDYSKKIKLETRTT